MDHYANWNAVRIYVRSIYTLYCPTSICIAYFYFKILLKVESSEHLCALLHNYSYNSVYLPFWNVGACSPTQYKPIFKSGTFYKNQIKFNKPDPISQVVAVHFLRESPSFRFFHSRINGFPAYSVKIEMQIHKDFLYADFFVFPQFWNKSTLQKELIQEDHHLPNLSLAKG